MKILYIIYAYNNICVTDHIIKTQKSTKKLSTLQKQHTQLL